MGQRYFKGIAGLRALAVLSVVAFHINRDWLPGGFVGVDVFFVISGFVVAHSIADRPDQGLVSYISWFYRRRFSRILPAAMLYIFVASLASFAFVPLVGNTKFMEPTGVAAIFGLSNIVLFLKSGDYFALASDYNFFTHTWSLAVEEQYYFIFPFFSYLLFIAKNRHPTGRLIALALVFVGVSASIVAAAWFTRHNPSFAFYMLPTRFWELGIGFLLRYYLNSRIVIKYVANQDELAPILAIAALISLIVSFVITSEDRFPFPGAILPCLSTGALIAMMWHYPSSAVDRLLSSRPFRWFGDISYSLYLWHWGVIVLLRWTIGIDTLPIQLAALAAMILLGWLSYAYVELPVQGVSRRSKAKPAKLFFRFGVVATTLAAVVTCAYLMKPRYGYAAANRVADWDPQAVPALPPGCRVEKKIDALGAGSVFTFPTNCSRKNAPRLYVVGDSHAGGYLRALYGIAATGVRTAVQN